jgi:hypothetical protein
MRSLEKQLSRRGVLGGGARTGFGAGARLAAAWWMLPLVFLAFVIVTTGCHKSVAEDASDSDANGYVCVKCDAKYYTDRSVFIGPKCPKCQEDTLFEVVGYVCAADNHLTLRARMNDRHGAPVCDQCKAPVSAMRLPRERDLKAWGATKTSS